MDAFIKKGFYTVGALKSNRVIYPHGIRQKISSFALHLRKTDSAVRLVTVGSRKYYVYRYEGQINGLENAVILITYPKDAFLVPKALRAFISIDTSLSTRQILDIYVERWPIEVFFRQSKNVLAFDKVQLRSARGIRRFWLLMSLSHFICVTSSGSIISFEQGYSFFQNRIIQEQMEFIYLCGVHHVPFNEVLAITA